MKRYWTILLLLCLLLTGCSAPAPIVPKDCAEVGQAILASQSFSDGMYEQNQKKLLKALGLEESAISQCYMILDASRYTAENIMVVTASSDAALPGVQKAMEEYRLSLLEQYRDYQPKEMPKLEAAQVLTHGLQCVLVIAPDQAAARKAAEGAW